ncbi:hypothetical protein [Methylobacterium sp. WL64]|uniref:hypothetical protein n=2 Tax=Methylobacterium TaxID=407 RepID=UPI00164FBDC4|nr:hypothetical protein [Methylobacterium sp. WL64]
MIDGPFKVEVSLRRKRWQSSEVIEIDTCERVDWCDTRRRLEPIGSFPPDEAVARHEA